MSLLIFAVCVLTVLVLALIVMVFALARQIGILFERISPVGAMVNDSGPKLGEVSPAFNLPSLTDAAQRESIIAALVAVEAEAAPRAAAIVARVRAAIEGGAA